ncbi:hypothetical protein EDC04DRAFT_456996 [Pisolithus marmoratus]|nr:hypothetical protein EDC04DRAFT_456996 [Pisolithus marmoratus]
MMARLLGRLFTHFTIQGIVASSRANCEVYDIRPTESSGLSFWEKDATFAEWNPGQKQLALFWHGSFSCACENPFSRIPSAERCINGNSSPSAHVLHGEKTTSIYVEFVDWVDKLSICTPGVIRCQYLRILFPFC